MLKARICYLKLALAFLLAALRMDAAMLAEIRSGLAQEYWHYEVERRLWEAANG